MSQDIRWQQRFQNFSRAVALLREPFEIGLDSLSELEQAGAIQRFEFTVELAWKTLNDYLESEGVTVQPATPRAVMKEAFARQVLIDGQVWIDMLIARNNLSHRYDESLVRPALEAMRDRYLPALEELHQWLAAKQ